MKKILLLAVIGLIAGVGGGTGIAVVMRSGAPTDSVAHDSVAVSHDSTVVVEPHDSSTSEQRAANGEQQAHSEQPSANSEPPTPKHAETVAVAPAPSLVERPVPQAESDSAHRTQVRRIGRIFASMAPREAAKVLQQLEDADVMVIVGSLNEKQAAAILQALPAERAAAISKGSLRPQAPTRGLRP